VVGGSPVADTWISGLNPIFLIEEFGVKKKLGRDKDKKTFFVF
jgi:hypothetical protein